MNTNKLMEKVRLLSILQRLKRTLGEQDALDLVMSVVDQEFKATINKCYEKETSTGKTQSQS